MAKKKKPAPKKSSKKPAAKPKKVARAKKAVSRKKAAPKRKPSRRGAREVSVGAIPGKGLAPAPQDNRATSKVCPLSRTWIRRA